MMKSSLYKMPKRFKVLDKQYKDSDLIFYMTDTIHNREILFSIAYKVIISINKRVYKNNFNNKTIISFNDGVNRGAEGAINAINKWLSISENERRCYKNFETFSRWSIEKEIQHIFEMNCLPITHPANCVRRIEKSFIFSNVENVNEYSLSYDYTDSEMYYEENNSETRNIFTPSINSVLNKVKNIIGDEDYIMLLHYYSGDMSTSEVSKLFNIEKLTGRVSMMLKKLRDGMDVDETREAIYSLSL